MIASTLDPTANPNLRIYPARPDWSDPFRVSYEFKTDIITADDGSEQRRAVRRYPRKTVEFRSVVNGVSKLALDRFLLNWHAKTTVLPEYSRSVTLRQHMEPGQFNNSFFEVKPRWIYVGAPVVLAYGNQIETRTVSVAVNSTIAFAETSTADWPPGTKVHPALTGRVLDQLKASHLTSDVETLVTQFAVDPGTETYPDTEGTLVDWREGFFKKPNWASPLDVTNTFPRDVVDYGYGRAEYFEGIKFPIRVIRSDFVGRNADDVDAVLDFFLRQKGRRGEFLLPTWENDVEYSFILGNSPTILVAGTDFGKQYADSTVFRQVVLRMADGTYVVGTVDYVEVLEETNSSAIQLVEPLPAREFSPATMFGVSWLLGSRFGSDRLDIDWITDNVAQFGLTFQTLENFA